jgi:hypothetical protein
MTILEDKGARKMKKISLILATLSLCGFVMAAGSPYLPAVNPGDINSSVISSIAKGAATNFQFWVNTGSNWISTNVVITGSGIITNVNQTPTVTSPNLTYTTNGVVVNSNFVWTATDTNGAVWTIQKYGSTYATANFRLYRGTISGTNYWDGGVATALTSGVWATHGDQLTGNVTVTSTLVTNYVYDWVQAFTGTTNVTTNATMTFVNGLLWK